MQSCSRCWRQACARRQWRDLQLGFPSPQTASVCCGRCPILSLMSPYQRLFLLLFLSFGSHAVAQSAGPISQEQLLTWAIGGMTAEHELAALKARGLQSNSAELVSAVTATGAKDAVIAYLRTSTLPQKEDLNPSFAVLVKT